MITSICANCGDEILKDDNLGKWIHTYTGGERCEIYVYAEPTIITVEGEN